MKWYGVVAVCAVCLIAAGALRLEKAQREKRLDQGMDELRSLPVPHNGDYWPRLRGPRREGGRAPNGPPIAPRNSSHIALRPGEVYVLPNTRMSEFRIASSYPVQVIAGGCESRSTTSLDCPASEEPIRIRDARERGRVSFRRRITRSR